MDPQSAASIPLLAVLAPKVRAAVLENAKRRTFAPDEIVVREGDSALHLYIVATGHARIERADQGVVARIGPGDFFGELALIEEHDRTATVVADDELTCLLMPVWEFRALLQEHPELALPMLHALIARVHRREHHQR
jgi:CRP-like cAMP-binding protein